MILKVVPLILATLAAAECYKFLVIFPMPARSHLILGDALVGELLKHGHEVTLATPFPTKKPTKGLTELDYSYLLTEWQENAKKVLPSLMRGDKMDVALVKEMACNMTYAFLRGDPLQKVLLDKDQQFDAVISEWFFTDILTTVSSVLDAPSILFSTVGMHANLEYIMDEVASPGMLPNGMSGYTSPMTFFERLANTAMTFLMVGSTVFYDHPVEAHMHKVILGPIAAARGIPLPDYYEVIHSASILLANSHPSLTAATKLPPNVIEIGGFHVDDAPSPLTPNAKKVLPSLMRGDKMDVALVKEMACNMTYAFLRGDPLQKVLLDKDQQFDAVISEWFFTDILTTVSSVLDAPSILFSTVGMHANLEYIMDEVASPGMLPNGMSGYTSPMTFFERLANTAMTFLMVGSTVFYDHPVEAHMHKVILGPIAAARGIPLPDYYEVIHSASILLANSHPSLTAATKLPPNVIEIGGFHVDDAPSPLTPKLQKIMDESKHGVIYFSLGSNLQSSDLGPEMRDSILNIFKGLKETVLWKFEADIPNLPSNVHIEKWMPQQSVLAHPKLKCFITHGGLLSTTEAIHHGVPLIGIPFFGDQHLNMAKSTKRGFALQVVLQDPNFAEILTAHIKEMLNNPKYGAKAKELSRLYHDRPVKPKDLAVYWVEYVVRTGGALHLRSLALSVPWYQRYLLDIFALLAAVLLVVIYAVKCVVKKVFGKKKKSKQE